ncbi:MAG TPA: HAMP domain-containing sensor histidine kinase [Vicinamibacterales bacterium]|nr:HAMP domain-containing sensor histidine kinase [Vicinamibacterales bacterium]
MTGVRSRDALRYVLSVAWIVFTVSLAAWWLVFGLSQARELQSAGGEAARLAHVQRMLVWEGIVLIALLLAGGIALIVAIRRERERRRQVEGFFTAFTHDLKTALASLRIQAESLQEDLPEASGSANLRRLLKDAVRLELQLENSLYFAQPDGSLHLEAVDVSALASRVAADWPEMIVQVDESICARADERALQSVLRNLIQNAALHGAARTITVTAEHRPGRVAVRVADDGKGAPEGVIAAINVPFQRLADTSGTGVGLYTSRQLLSRMNGALRIDPAPAQGFALVVDLPDASC